MSRSEAAGGILGTRGARTPSQQISPMSGTQQWDLTGFASGGRLAVGPSRCKPSNPLRDRGSPGASVTGQSSVASGGRPSPGEARLGLPSPKGHGSCPSRLVRVVPSIVFRCAPVLHPAWRLQFQVPRLAPPQVQSKQSHPQAVRCGLGSPCGLAARGLGPKASRGPSSCQVAAGARQPFTDAGAVSRQRRQKAGVAWLGRRVALQESVAHSGEIVLQDRCGGAVASRGSRGGSGYASAIRCATPISRAGTHCRSDTPGLVEEARPSCRPWSAAEGDFAGREWCLDAVRARVADHNSLGQCLFGLELGGSVQADCGRKADVCRFCRGAVRRREEATWEACGRRRSRAPCVLGRGSGCGLPSDRVSFAGHGAVLE